MNLKAVISEVSGGTVSLSIDSIYHFSINVDLQSDVYNMGCPVTGVWMTAAFSLVPLGLSCPTVWGIG